MLQLFNLRVCTLYLEWIYGSAYRGSLRQCWCRIIIIEQRSRSQYGCKGDYSRVASSIINLCNYNLMCLYPQNGITPLHVASKRGHTRFCAMLIDRDADLRAQTKDGLIPLHCAARSGHKPVVELLLEKMNTAEIIRTKVWSSFNNQS